MEVGLVATRGLGALLDCREGVGEELGVEVAVEGLAVDGAAPAFAVLLPHPAMAAASIAMAAAEASCRILVLRWVMCALPCGLMKAL